MSKQLTIVVTCTDRKSVPPLPERHVRCLPLAPLESRIQDWKSIMTATCDTHRLRDLYRGDAWQQLGRLESVAASKGFRPSTLVASAGLGLREVESVAPSYSATFAIGQADSVGRTRLDNQHWWESLNDVSAGCGLETRLSGSTLFVLSESYASAMANDLLPLKGRDDVVIFGGTPGVLPEQRFASDLGLRDELGGTAVSLNVRMAIAWLQAQPDRSVSASASRQNWDRWVASVRTQTSFDRRPIDDSSLRTWIRKAKSGQPQLSKSAALRQLRDSGVACEQRRFGAVFARVAEET